MLISGSWKAELGCQWHWIGRSSLCIRSCGELQMRQPAAKIAPRDELAFAEGHSSQGNILARQGSVWPSLALPLIIRCDELGTTPHEERCIRCDEWVLRESN